VFLLLALSGALHAQEFLTGNKINPQIFNEAKQNRGKSETEVQPLRLPFFEDFSNYTGYPNENLFIDKQAFVNNTFPVFPPTIGVVTLDALNEYGEVYPHLGTTSRGADTLTSRFIRLDSLFVGETGKEITPADSLYFSFFFQPGGVNVAGNSGEVIGSQPNKNDSLVLEFGYTKEGITYWDHVWATPGFNVSEWISENPFQYFKQILIPITHNNYLCDSFQFRFRNYASLEPQPGITGWEGNVDQWHIDYIRLDVNRNINDAFSDDLAFVSPTTSFLKNYQAMPWKQFQNTDMNSNFTNQLTNLNNPIDPNNPNNPNYGIRTSKYQYTITLNGNIEAQYASGSIDIRPYYTHGIQIYPSQASPTISYKPNSLKDTATFVITHVFQNDAGIDIYPQNDTCVFEQKFANYYAYDDGTAEYGYCLNNQYNIAYLAMKFPLHVQDTLSAVQMWFNHTKNDENKDAVFSIVVWKDADGEPGEVLYKMDELRPQFSEQFLDFVEYRFDKKFPVSGTIWVGFQQQGNVQLNIGFDQNNDAREFFRYNTRGIWETSAYKGVPMLRPMFGELKKPNSIDQTSVTSTTILYPNPANKQVTITNYALNQVQGRITSIEIFDIYGRKCHASRVTCHENNIDISHFPAGIYFVRVTTENHAIETLKLIKN
jgi:hypothetical protein